MLQTKGKREIVICISPQSFYWEKPILLIDFQRANFTARQLSGGVRKATVAGSNVHCILNVKVQQDY